MTKFADWLFGLVIAIFTALWDFLTDIVIAIVTLFLTAVLSLIQALTPPQFATNGLQGIISAIPSDVWFFAQHFQLGNCLALFGAAFTFRMARKAVTLFQW